MTIDGFTARPARTGDRDSIADAVTLESLLRSAWRYRILLVALTLLFAAAAYGASLLATEVFRSETRVFLSDPRYTTSESDSARRRIDPAVYTVQQVRRVTSDPVLRLASADLDRQWSFQELKSRIEAQPQEEALIIRVRADADTPANAARMAMATANAFRRFNEETARGRLEAAMADLGTAKQHLRDQISANQDDLDEDPDSTLLRARAAALHDRLVALDTTARGLAVDATSFGSGVDFIEAAEVPSTPIQPNPRRNAALGGAIGFVAAVALADVLSRRRRWVASRTDPEHILSAPLLGEVPARAANVLRSNGSVPNDQVGEAFRIVLASLEFALAQHGGAVVAITGVDSGDESAISAAHLAFAAARDGKRVGLVDCDVWTRRLTRLFGANSATGITDLAQGRVDYREFLESGSVLDNEITVIPAGHGAAEGELFHAAEFEEGIGSLSAAVDLLLLETPPLLQAADASIVAERADGLVLTVRRGTAIVDLERVAERLSFISVPLLGYIYQSARSLPRPVREIRRMQKRVNASA